MKDLSNPSLIKLKGIMFLIIGIISGVLLILEHPTLKFAALLAIAIGQLLWHVPARARSGS